MNEKHNNETDNHETLKNVKKKTYENISLSVC